MVEAFMQLHEIQRAFDDAAARLEREIGTSLCVRCGNCCQQTPTWMTIEALNAVSVLLGRPAYRQAVSAAEGWLLDRGNLKVFEGIKIGFPSDKLMDEWNQICYSRCPFLVQNDCLIYEARPLICRAYGVTRLAGDNCCRRPGKGETLTQRRYVQPGLLREAVQLYKKLTAERNPAWIYYGQVPTLFYRCAEEAKFRRYVKDNRIASAKLCGVDCDLNIMFQPELDAINAGVAPELVAMLR